MTEDKKRDRHLLSVAGGLFALSLCVLGGLSYRQRQAARSEPAPLLREPRRVPDFTPDVKAQYIEHAKLLRAKLEPWARAHQVELRQMMRARAGDVAALEAVRQQIPPVGDTIGIMPKDLMSSDHPGRGIFFGWAGLNLHRFPQRNSSPKQQAMAEKGYAMGLERLREDFEQHHDVLLMGSGGRTRTQIWSSGRITQMTELDGEERGKKWLRFEAEGKPFRPDDIYGPIQEIAPPYDFLTSPTIS